MKVYILYRMIPFEGEEVIAVYTDSDRAVTCMNILQDTFPSNSYRLQSMETV